MDPTNRKDIYLHSKSSVRFVYTIIPHGLFVGHAGEGSAEGLFVFGPGVLKQALNQSPDSGLLHKGHLNVHLCGQTGQHYRGRWGWPRSRLFNFIYFFIFWLSFSRSLLVRVVWWVVSVGSRERHIIKSLFSIPRHPGQTPFRRALANPSSGWSGCLSRPHLCEFRLSVRFGALVSVAARQLKVPEITSVRETNKCVCVCLMPVTSLNQIFQTKSERLRGPGKRLFNYDSSCEVLQVTNQLKSIYSHRSKPATIRSCLNCCGLWGRL